MIETIGFADRLDDPDGEDESCIWSIWEIRQFSFERGKSWRHPTLGARAAVDCGRLAFRGRKSRLEITAWGRGSCVLVNV